MSRILIAIDLNETTTGLNFTHKLEFSEDLPQHLMDYYTDYYCGLLEFAVQPDSNVDAVRRKKFVLDFYRSVLVENQSKPPVDNVIPLHPPVKKIEGKK